MYVHTGGADVADPRHAGLQHLTRAEAKIHPSARFGNSIAFMISPLIGFAAKVLKSYIVSDASPTLTTTDH